MRTIQPAKPNVILILADQLRADCVGCYGNSVIKTPHIDALAARGVKFHQTFAQHPQCAPSRAALMTGRYPHVNGAISNHTAMSDNEVTLGEHFIGAGYQSIGVGKLHLFSKKEEASFSVTRQSGGQNSDAVTPDCLHEDYKTWLRDNGHWPAAEQAYDIHATDKYWEDFQANVNPIPQEAFIDTWVGDRAVDFINEQTDEAPFFMFVGLPNPHTPFDCPEPYASMYADEDMPVPDTFFQGLEDKPPIHAKFKRQGRRVNYENLTESKLRRAMALYYGAVSLVDDQVGKIVAAVAANGMSENTIVAFSSDHGELLGHFGMLTKGIDEYPMLYDVGLRVPMIISSPVGAAGHSFTNPVELIDLCPTLLGCAGTVIPPEIQGQDLSPIVHGETISVREAVYSESGAVKMLRGPRYKLVYYPGQPFGELYDIQEDPHERQNLFGRDEYRSVRGDMMADLLDRLILTEGPRHGESGRGPAYWRTLYGRAFEDLE